MEPTMCPFCGERSLLAASEDTNPTDTQGNLLTEYVCEVCAQAFYA